MTNAGPDLKAIREAKGISLKDIYNATRVSVPILEAIEGGRFHLLPEPVYARTFIKSYAKFLDMDSKPTLDLYEQYLRSLTGAPSFRENMEKNAESRQKSAKKRRTVLWMVVLAAAAASLLYLLWANDSKAPQVLNTQTAPPQKAALPVQQPTLTDKPADAPPVASQPDPLLKPAKEVTPEAPVPTGAVRKSESAPAAVPQVYQEAADRNPGGPDEKRLRLVITGIEKTWLRVRADRNRPDETILHRGDVFERFAADSFAVDIGNAGGVDVSFQGQSLGTLGERGQVVRLKLP